MNTTIMNNMNNILDLHVFHQTQTLLRNIGLMQNVRFFFLLTIFLRGRNNLTGLEPDYMQFTNIT